MVFVRDESEFGSKSRSDLFTSLRTGQMLISLHVNFRILGFHRKRLIFKLAPSLRINLMIFLFDDILVIMLGWNLSIALLIVEIQRKQFKNKTLNIFNY